MGWHYLSLDTHFWHILFAWCMGYFFVNFCYWISIHVIDIVLWMLIQTQKNAMYCLYWYLTYWGQGKMAVIFQTFSSAVFWLKNIISIKISLNFLPLNQWWLDCWCTYVSLGLKELRTLFQLPMPSVSTVDHFYFCLSQRNRPVFIKFFASSIAYLRLMKKTFDDA